MSRPNDIGGRESYRLEIDTSLEPFHSDWEAHVFAMNVALVRRGAFTFDEFRDAIERQGAAKYARSTYYERWLNGLELILHDKGLIPRPGEGVDDEHPTG